MTVRQTSGERLQKRRSHLKNQRDDADLCECKAEFLFEKRIDRRNDGLHHVVEQMSGANHQQDRINCPVHRITERPRAGGVRIHGLRFFQDNADRMQRLPGIPGDYIPYQPFVRRLVADR